MVIPEINPYITGQLISYKGAMAIQWRKEYSLQQIVLEQRDIQMQMNEVLDSSYTKINTIYIKYLNIGVKW